MSRLNKNGQEEMVGFVLIMLVVAIIFLIFLGIYFRTSSVSSTESKEISTFLESLSKLTTQCGPNEDYPLDVSELILECYEVPSSLCHNGKNKCDILRETLGAAVNKTWNFNENSPTKAYNFELFKETSFGPQPLFIPQLSEGIMTGTVRSSEKPFPGGIFMRLEIGL